MSNASQNRRKISEGIFLITSNTLNRFPYFNEGEFAEIFIEDLFFATMKKEFDVVAYKINPDHIHLIVDVKGLFSLSEILQNIKRASSLHCNQLLYGKSWNEKLEWNESLMKKHLTLHRKYGKDILEIPMFRWQPSFYDLSIRNEAELKSYLSYIEYQWIKHHLPENKFCFVKRETK